MKCQYVGKEYIVHDRSANELAVGDLVLDPRGRIWRIEPTEGTFLQIRILRAVEVGVLAKGGVKPKNGARAAMPQRAYDVHRIAPTDVMALDIKGRARYFETLDKDCAERLKSGQQIRERKQLARVAIENASSHDRMLWGKTFPERHAIEDAEAKALAEQLATERATGGYDDIAPEIMDEFEDMLNA